MSWNKIAHTDGIPQLSMYFYQKSFSLLHYTVNFFIWRLLIISDAFDPLLYSQIDQKNVKGGYKVMFLKVCICSKMDLLLKNANTFIIIIQIICLQETLYHGALSALKKYSFDFNESSSNLYSWSTVHQHLSFKIDSPTILNHSEW